MKKNTKDGLLCCVVLNHRMENRKVRVVGVSL